LRRNCLLKHVIGGEVEGRIIVTGRRGRKSKQLLDDTKERRVPESEGGSSRLHSGELALGKAMDL